MSQSARSNGTAAEEASSSDSDKFKFSSNLSLETIRQIQADFAKERNWEQYHSPRNILLAMVAEVGEVSECFQWKGEVKDGLPDWAQEEKTHLGEELSDVLVYLIRLADRCQVDLPAAVLRKIELNRQKYPASKVYGKSDKYTAYSDSDS
uniref:dCTP pyrophosphatase 1 n=1 Tax=Amblyomma aureolatum TaxID=187763 RepID=A0A1E1WXZ0_9ACAR